MAVAVTCSKVFTHCAYTLASGAENANIPAWLDHIDQEHNMSHPRQDAKLKDALTFA